MVKDIDQLIALCDSELSSRQYRNKYQNLIRAYWTQLRTWLEEKKISEFDEVIANHSCDEMFGCHLLPKRPTPTLRLQIRSIRLLITFQKTGDFEYRSPKVEYTFDGSIGTNAITYLEYCKTVKNLSIRTLENLRLYLNHFSKFMLRHSFSYENISVKTIEDFFKEEKYSLACRHNCAGTLKRFLRFVYDSHIYSKDCSVFVMPDNYQKNCKLPTTYEPDEIRRMIDSVERASPIGKRDYLILLLLAQYGWRAMDVATFSFNDIDWDANVIRFKQHKTGLPVEYPLLASIGNAIIDYLQNSRPNSNAPEIIVSLSHQTKGKPLSTSSLHSIVCRYMKEADIKDWNMKKHGPHALRHSLATNLLKKNVSMPVISSVIGHQNTESTSVYISVDFDKLKLCALPMPSINSPHYKEI